MPHPYLARIDAVARAWLQARISPRGLTIALVLLNCAKAATGDVAAGMIAVLLALGLIVKDDDDGPRSAPEAAR